MIGRPLPLIDAVEKVRGESTFAADILLPRMLVGKLLPSPYAHAEILAIDTGPAEALPGVRAVITAADIPQVKKYDPGSRFHAFLARRFAVFVGQPVAAVAAEDASIAEAALELITVKYKILPAVTDLERAIIPDCPAARPDLKKNESDSPNVTYRYTFEHGDLAAAFSESDCVIEHIYHMPSFHQGYLEPHAVTAFWDRPNHVTVWECVQGAFWARDLIAETLGIPRVNISLMVTEIGGGFGGKAEGIFAPLAVLLAKKAGLPVKLVLTRREELTGANPGPHTIIRIKTGATKEGRFTGLEGRVLMDAGAFTNPNALAINIAYMLGSKYKFQAWRLEGVEVITNKASSGSYRAPGAVNACLAIESQVDEMAGRLGFDPVVLRLQNIAAEGDLLPNLRPQGPVRAKEVLTAIADHPVWAHPPAARIGKDGRLHGRGLALGLWGSGAWPSAAVAKLEAEARISIVTGQVDLSGSFTSLAQIAAETMGISVQQIAVINAGTDQAPYAPVSGGSGTVYSMGAAVQEAVLDLKAKILDRDAQRLNVPESELAINDKGVFLIAKPDQSLSFETLYQLGTDLFTARYGPLIGQGSLLPRRQVPAFSASVAEVTVDPETGQVILTRLVTAQDVGKAINPLSVEGQMQGAAGQSAGMALWEEVLYDEEGRVLNPNLLDYHMPTSADLPWIETILVESTGGDVLYGAKGVGEPPIIPPVAAVANAVASAIGVRLFQLPITPERVWRALKSKGAK
jgi:CO/xanthine dehydrogenase Mo-binding subunit